MGEDERKAPMNEKKGPELFLKNTPCFFKKLGTFFHPLGTLSFFSEGAEQTTPSLIRRIDDT